MEIKTLEFGGLLSALQALRLPFGKDPRSRLDYNLKTTEKEDVLFLDSGYYIEMNPNDLELLSTIIKRGDEHAKVLRGVQIYAKIKAPIYWWSKDATYEQLACLTQGDPHYLMNVFSENLQKEVKLRISHEI